MDHRVAVAALLALGLSNVGCDKKNEASLAPAASSLAPSTTPAAAEAVTFTIDPKSTSSIEMPAPKEQIKATTTGAAGSLDVVLTDLARSRGEVKIDLTTLTTATFDQASKNEAQTGHARTWLEVADGDKGPLEESVKTANRWAVYAIRSIDDLSAPDLTKVAPTKDGADDVRTVTMTTRGELLIHGRKVERDAGLEVQFRYDAGADPARPKLVVAKTTRPLRVVLAEHDVKPRDGVGKIAKEAFHLLGTKVADTADISLALRAAPQT
jgi:hypothetical protein